MLVSSSILTWALYMTWTSQNPPLVPPLYSACPNIPIKLFQSNTASGIRQTFVWNSSLRGSSSPRPIPTLRNRLNYARRFKDGHSTFLDRVHVKNFSEDLIADAYLHWLSLLRMWRTQVCHRLVSISLRQRHYWAICTRLNRPFTSHRFLSTSAASAPDALPSISTKSDNTTKNIHDASVQFENLGLNQVLSRQVISAIPNIIRPTTAQTALIPVLQKLNDVIIRAGRNSDPKM